MPSPLTIPSYQPSLTEWGLARLVAASAAFQAETGTTSADAAMARVFWPCAYEEDDESFEASRALVGCLEFNWPDEPRQRLESGTLLLRFQIAPRAAVEGFPQDERQRLDDLVGLMVTQMRAAKATANSAQTSRTYPNFTLWTRTAAGVVAFNETRFWESIWELRFGVA